MAMLLFLSVRPLTCRTVGMLQAMRTSLHVHTLSANALSHTTLQPLVRNRSPDFKLIPHKIWPFSDGMVSCCRGCSSFQQSGDSTVTSKPLSDETDGKHVVIKDRSDVGYLHNEHSAVPGEYVEGYLQDEQPAVPDVYVEATSTPLPVEKEAVDHQELALPRPMEPSFNLAPYVAQSEVLQNLVALGVDLSVMEKVKEAADFLVQCDWAADIQPRLLFLRDVGVDDAKLGQVLNKNPLLLKEDMEDMQERISYLQSKKFSGEQIAHIVTTAPLTLLFPVHYVDKKLGYLQKTFHLTGDDVRMVATRLPKIIPWKMQKLKDLRFYMKEMLGFSDRELKTMLLAVPRVFVSDRHQLGKRFHFLHNVMGLSHQHLTTWPSVFRTRLHILEQRHRFLLHLGRAQYDPTKENYVSLKALVTGRDQEFCSQVAKASPDQFYSFLKSL